MSDLRWMWIGLLQVLATPICTAMMQKQWDTISSSAIFVGFDASVVLDTGDSKHSANSCANLQSVQELVEMTQAECFSTGQRVSLVSQLEGLDDSGLLFSGDC